MATVTLRLPSVIFRPEATICEPTGGVRIMYYAAQATYELHTRQT